MEKIFNVGYDRNFYTWPYINQIYFCQEGDEVAAGQEIRKLNQDVSQLRQENILLKVGKLGGACIIKFTPDEIFKITGRIFKL